MNLADYQREAAVREGRVAVSRARAVLKAVPHDAPGSEKARAVQDAAHLIQEAQQRADALANR